MSERALRFLVILARTDAQLAIPADDIRGWMVVDQAGYELGRVEDLIIDPGTGDVFFMVVRPSGMVADEGRRLIPIDAVGRRTDESVRVDLDFEQVAAGPRYVPELMSDLGYQAGVYGWYGYVPYWHPGYLRPSGRHER